MSWKFYLTTKKKIYTSIVYTKTICLTPNYKKLTSKLTTQMKMFFKIFTSNSHSIERLRMINSTSFDKTSSSIFLTSKFKNFRITIVSSTKKKNYRCNVTSIKRTTVTSDIQTISTHCLKINLKISLDLSIKYRVEIIKTKYLNNKSTQDSPWHPNSKIHS